MHILCVYIHIYIYIHISRHGGREAIEQTDISHASN